MRDTTKTPSQTAKDIAYWLADHVTKDGFPARTFYGESFAVWLWSLFPGEFERGIELMLPRALQQLHRTDKQAHPEFNLFALLNYCHTRGVSPTDIVRPFPTLRNTATSNWILLGTLDRLLWNRLAEEKRFAEAPLRLHTRLLLFLQQQKDSLIRDDRLLTRWLPLPFPFSTGRRLGIRYVARLRNLSLQYHCFSLALLWDISQLINGGEFKDAVERGIRAILLFALPNGDTLYLGRGQQQIFGYAALLYVLAAFSASSPAASPDDDKLESRDKALQGRRPGEHLQVGRTPDSASLPLYARASTHGRLHREARWTWARVWKWVSSYQRSDGSFPLVLRRAGGHEELGSGLEHGYPHTVDTSDPRWLGWYSYNNYFDYLPFLGVTLARTSPLLQAEEEKHPLPPHKRGRRSLSSPPPRRRGGKRGGGSTGVWESVVATRRYAVIREGDWQATIATPGKGALANDQPAPYLCIDGQSVLPCFGGEEYSGSPYRLEMLSLPYFTDQEGQPIYLRNAMTWSLSRGNLEPKLLLRGRCQWAEFERIYTWSAHEFTMRDSLWIFKPSPDLAEVFPLVFSAFWLDRQADGSYRIHPDVPGLALRVQGVEGQIEIISGVSPTGPTQVLRERLLWRSNGGQALRRVMQLSFPSKRT
jgi:hypothetical protein